MAQAIETLINEAMKLQRSEALRAEPYQHTYERRGHADGSWDRRASMRRTSLRFPSARKVDIDS